MELINGLPLSEKAKLHGLFKSVRMTTLVMDTDTYHSSRKGFFGLSRGVSSKYLNNYLIWGNELERKKVSLAEKEGVALRQIVSAGFEVTCSTLTKRPAIPILVKN